MSFLLIRHGHTRAHAAGRYVGVTDEPLSALGRRQAVALRGILDWASPDLVYASPLSRARDTASLALISQRFSSRETQMPRMTRLATEHKRDVPMQIWPDLAEVNFGDWEARSFAEIAASASPEQIDAWAVADDAFAFPGGESLGQLRARAAAAACELRRQQRANPTIAVFSHGGFLRCLICALLDRPAIDEPQFALKPGAVALVDPDRNGIEFLDQRQIQATQGTAHLSLGSFFDRAETHPRRPETGRTKSC